MAAWQEYSTQLRKQHHTEFVRRLKENEFGSQVEKLDYLNHFHSVLKERKAEWKVLQVSVVAGAGSNLHLRPEQVKMVAGTGVDHDLRSAPVKMVAGACTHLNLLFRTAA